MMFASTEDLVDPIYSIDPSLTSPLDYFEFDGSILHWNNMSHDQPPFGTNNEPISTSTKMALSKGDINGIGLEQEKGNAIGYNHGSNKKKARVSKRGPSKGDRHSKIPTANGLRDRRMRLPLDVAKQFFKLQDMLGYDRPSKTVKWLLLQAKPAIEELQGKQSPCSGDATKSVSSNYSEGEVVESAIDHEDSVKVVAKATTSKEKSKKKTKKKRNFDQFRPVAKEMRKEARERARERTLKKKQALGDFGGRLDEAGNLRPYDMKPCSSDVVFEVEQQVQGEITQNWSSLMSLSYHHEDDSCKMNPNSESQQGHPYMGQYWFY